MLGGSEGRQTCVLCKSLLLASVLDYKREAEVGLEDFENLREKSR